MIEWDYAEKLRSGRPHAAGVPDLAAHRTRILNEVRRRRLALWGAGVAGFAFLLGGTSISVAATWQAPWPWDADNVAVIEQAEGSACLQGFLVQWEGFSDTDPAVLAAQQIVGSIDLASIDTSQEEAVWAKSYTDAAYPDGEPAPSTSVSDGALRQVALADVVAHRMWNELASRGYTMTPDHQISLFSEINGCD